MTFANYLNIAGVIGTTVGSALVWFFVVEVTSNNHKEFLAGADFIRFTVPTPTPELRKKIKRELFLSRLGIALIVLGGILQVVATLQ